MEVPVDRRRRCVVIPVPADHPVLQPGEYALTEPGLARELGGDHLLFSCPGCGRTGAIRAANHKPASPSWQIVAGSLSDPASLTLEPSIHCVGCCGWHGYLRKGVFEPC